MLVWLEISLSNVGNYFTLLMIYLGATLKYIEGVVRLRAGVSIVESILKTTPWKRNITLNNNTSTCKCCDMELGPDVTDIKSGFTQWWFHRIPIMHRVVLSSAPEMKP